MAVGNGTEGHVSIVDLVVGGEHMDLLGHSTGADDQNAGCQRV